MGEGLRMALIFPLSLADFADKLKITTVRWWLQEYQETSMTGGGEFLVADLGPRLWKGSVTLAPMYHDEAAEVQALIESLDGSLNAFLLCDPRKRYPKGDPKGSLVASSSPVISALPSSNKELSITGLPAGYALSSGDMFSFTYGANPVRRALHRIVNTVTANGSGVASGIEVRPHFRPGVATGVALTFRKPTAKVRIIPGSFEPGTAGAVHTEGMKFDVQQVL